TARTDADVDRVGPRAADVHGVLQPLAGYGGLHLVAAVNVVGELQVDPFVAIDPVGIGRRRVVIRDPLAALVEVLRLDTAGQRDRRAGVRRGRDGRRRRRTRAA